jgi:hypothetical protein
VDLGPIKVSTQVKTQLENDLALELAAVEHLNTAIRVARELGDNASRARSSKRFWATRKSMLTIWRDNCTLLVRRVSRIIWRSSFTKARRTKRANGRSKFCQIDLIWSTLKTGPARFDDVRSGELIPGGSERVAFFQFWP